MATLPDRDQQIVQVHAGLINQVVQACHNEEQKAELRPALKLAIDNGWTRLVAAIEQILDGKRDISILRGLDEEDTVIAEAILRGLQDPSTLPDPDRQADAAAAAPGLASIIHSAGKGDAAALQQIASMAETMSQAGGELALIASCIRPMVNGERDANVLCKNLSAQSESMILAILGELAKLNPQ